MNTDQINEIKKELHVSERFMAISCGLPPDKFSYWRNKQNGQIPHKYRDRINEVALMLKKIKEGKRLVETVNSPASARFRFLEELPETLSTLKRFIEDLHGPNATKQAISMLIDSISNEAEEHTETEERHNLRS